MHEKLETYLREISHYLDVKQGTDEILAEIRSHILEKASREAGGATEDAIQKIIDAYGSPRQVAASYMEGQEILSPTLKKYLIRYTAILFAIHAVLTAVAIHFNTSIIAIPFFFIPRMPVWSALVYLPMAFVYDFGVVALILCYVTQRKKDVRLPWFGASAGRRGASGMKRPRVGILVLRMAILGGLIYLFLRYHTIFFVSINMKPVESMLGPASSAFFSLMFIAAYACHVISYWVRFLFNSAWVRLAESVMILLILWVVWNSPIRPVYRSVPGVDLSLIGSYFTLTIIAVAVIGLLRSIVQLTREKSLP